LLAEDETIIVLLESYFSGETPMETTRLSNKGQIVIPHKIREQFGWKPGVEFAVEPIEGGVALKRIEEFDPTTIEEVYGCLHYSGPKKTLRDMEEGIRKGAEERA
jgi:AbrB family looped-hinge helix DNA binding protein